MEYEEVLRKFKQDCQNMQPDVVVQKHLIDGACYFFNNLPELHEEFEFKKTIAVALGAHIRDVAIVGSGKLGFSLKPTRDTPGLYEFNKFDKKYELDPNEQKSDLDVVVISKDLFDNQLEELYRFTAAYKNTKFSSAQLKEFAKYALKGWIRPEMVPQDYSTTKNIVVLSHDLSSKYQRPVNIGIYKSWYYFEQYHISNVQNISLNLIAN